PCWALVKARRREQSFPQVGVIDLRRDRPGDTDHLGTGNKPAPGRLANTRYRASLSDPAPGLGCKKRHRTNLPHRQPLRWHRLRPLFLGDRGGDQVMRVSTGALPARAYRQLLVII